MLQPFDHVKRVIDAEINKARVASRRATGRAIGWFVVAGLALMGLGMLALALFLALSDAYGHTVAALIVGGGLLVIAAIVALFAVGPLRSRKAEVAAETASRQARTDLASDISQVAALIEGFGAGSGSGGSKGASKILIFAAIGLGLGLVSKKVGKKSKNG